MTEPTATPAAADAVLLNRHDGWAEIVLNRPDRRNAIDGALADGLLAALQQAQADPALRALVLCGAGGALCSGLDLKAFGASPPPPWVAGFGARWRAVHVALAATRQVLLVALERYAINGGAALALAGDVLVCGRGAYLTVGEIRIGMAAPNNLAWLVLRHSEAVAARVALLGERLDADTLLRLGIATEVVDDQAVLARCRERAAEIGAWPADAVLRIKSTLRAASLRTTPADWFASVAEAPPLAPPREPDATVRT
jgi:enoyl-CoA hydratase/carnithine racemase